MITRASFLRMHQLSY